MWAEVITAISGSGITFGGTGALVCRWLKKEIVAVSTVTAETANRPLVESMVGVKTKVDSLELSLATQFGGNGGGMRQAINELQVSVARLEGMTSHPHPGPTP